MTIGLPHVLAVVAFLVGMSIMLRLLAINKAGRRADNLGLRLGVVLICATVAVASGFYMAF